MTLLSHLVLALAIAMQQFVALRNSTADHPVPLTRALLNAVAMSLILALFFHTGERLALLLRLELPAVDNALGLGLMLLVVVKTLFGLKRAASGADVGQWRGLLLLALAQSVNTLLLGLGTGFMAETTTSPLLWWLPIPLLGTLLGLWGAMLGRKNIDIRPRRWQCISLLCITAVALASYLL